MLQLLGAFQRRRCNTRGVLYVCTYSLHMHTHACEKNDQSQIEKVQRFQHTAADDFHSAAAEFVTKGVGYPHPHRSQFDINVKLEPCAL